jgi:murein DD-endopeptidase MepM/ murein hydrolase activator NlpD
MAKKERYHFDPISLTYQLIPIRFRDKLKRFLWTIATGSVFASVVLLVAYNFFSSPKERILLREIEQFKFQYRVLNDRMDRVQKVLADLQHRDDNVYRVIFEAEPIPASVRQSGIGGVDRYSKLEGFKNSDLLIETSKKLDKITSELYVQSKSLDEVFKLAKSKEVMLASLPAIQPMNSRDLKYISSYFGYRVHPFYKTRMFHEGIDFTAAIGTKVYATGNATVEEVVQKITDGYGKKIILNHGFGYKTIYGHLSAYNVRAGQTVKRGDLIGRVGNTGLSSGPHLHYEVQWNGKQVNPAYFMFDLKPKDFQDIIEQSPDFK